DLAGLVEVERGAQMIAHAWHYQRVRVGDGDQRQRPHTRAPARVGRQQRRLRVDLVQVFHDGHGLVEHVAVVLDQGGDHHLRIDGLEFGGALLPGIEVDVDGVVAEALEVERDAYAERGERAPVSVELHVSVPPQGASRATA